MGTSLFQELMKFEGVQHSSMGAFAKFVAGSQLDQLGEVMIQAGWHHTDTDELGFKQN